MALGEKRNGSVFATAAQRRDAAEYQVTSEPEIVPVVVDDTPQRTLNTDIGTLGRAHNLFFTPSAESRDFNSVLQEVQEYISGTYAALITEGGEDSKEQLMRYITKYLQDRRIAVAGMTQTELVDAIYELSGRDEQIFTDGHNHDDDFSFAVPGMGRFRVNVFRQRGSLGAVIRVIPFTLPNPADYHIPDDVMACADFQKGLVLVTGPAGAGKSTTLACIIDRINRERNRHIITLEDPIEYVHRHEKCIVTQREVPTDIVTYAEGLRSAMRESPDIILLGEMRDAETIGTAINAAEMTQLVLSTLHTTSAADTIERMIDAFPASQQRQIRTQLSLVLQATVSQMLIPALDGTTIPVFEVMHMNTAIRNLIREEKTYQIDSVIASNGAAGMQTMDQALFNAVREGKVAKDVALQYSHHQEALLRRFQAEGL